ncbi:hypothetical protein [Saccharothrix algeriensis]|uniref:Uncharacterized protein n=1 Tax=Saccharothrix algeriensis TaxID=173560 RepID=A0A8T8I3A4_9PSEU|nr:hypothetical protein [Saccharothrix algeriensis]MBM7811137.1 hypothetical protein [Saccharothrix algeriensis]QTR05068.1 hypothetical protein J7S33_10320 [Saccharothrix algeriensis]
MPEPVPPHVAASLATRAVASLNELVRVKFAGDPAALAALLSAEGAAPDSPQVRALSEVLGRAAAADPAFGEELRRRASGAQPGRVTNQVSGTVHGNVVQAGDIQGGVNFK